MIASYIKKQKGDRKDKFDFVGALPFHKFFCSWPACLASQLRAQQSKASETA